MNNMFPPETFSRETLDPWYVTGFVEGEGAFTFSRSSTQLALYFAVKLTADDGELLVALQDYFGGAGRIYSVAPRAAPTARSGYTKKARYYRVCRRDELQRVVDHFDRYPLHGLKAASFAIWREMVRLKLENFRRPAREQMEELAARLSAVSVRNKPFDEQ
jgi:hypothetical protein